MAKRRGGREAGAAWEEAWVGRRDGSDRKLQVNGLLGVVGSDAK